MVLPESTHYTPDATSETRSLGRVLVTGAAKAEAVRRAFRDEISDDAPASLLRRGEAPIDVYLDEAASGR